MDDPVSQPVATPKRSRKAQASLSQHVLAKAMLDSGYTYRSTAKQLGIGQQNVAKYKKQALPDLASTEHVEKIKKGLRNRFALIADQALNGLSVEKIGESSAKDLIYIAAKATEMAGLAPPSIVENYSRSISEYIIQDRPTTCSVPTSETEQLPVTGETAS